MPQDHTPGPRVDPGARPERLPPPRPGGPGRWRAGTLALVYVLMAVHIIHWKLSGRTLAPLELNEVMHTLELGVVTAGFIFMCVAFLSVLIFGRFFCSWGCHIVALQDLCAWILGKLRIRSRPLRSRLLLWVPPLTLFYMFVWPQLARVAVRAWPFTEAWLGPRPEFVLRVVSKGQGWESFVTDDFWRNLPSWPITTLTFAVCGFAIVFVLGSRSFCNYVCPYGAAFALADRTAPGSIRLKGTCVQCARCTATCSSGIQVHQEIATFGRVVSPSCLKDLDCVHACPQEAIGFGFGKPGGFASLGSKRARKKYDFTLGEELLIVALFAATLPIYRGLYDRIPFLLTLGLGVLHGTLAVFTIRLLRQPALRFRGFDLKHAGRITPAGGFLLVVATLIGGLFIHSGVIRAEEYLGTRGYAQLVASQQRGEQPPVSRIERIRSRLDRRQRWGFIESAQIERWLAELDAQLGDGMSAESRLGRIVSGNPYDASAQLELARLHALRGAVDLARRDLDPIIAGDLGDGNSRSDAEHLLASIALVEKDLPRAESHLRRAMEAAPLQIHAHLSLAELLAEGGNLPEAEEVLREAIERSPQVPEAHRRLGLVLLARGNVPEALAEVNLAVELAPDDPNLRVDLGRSLAGAKDFAGAETAFRKALSIDAIHQLANVCLGSLLRDLGRGAEAQTYLERAALSRPRN